MMAKNCILRKSNVPTIKRCCCEFSAKSKDNWIVWMTISTGTRELIKFYAFEQLQHMLTVYMDSIDADANDPNRNLMFVLETDRYSVLESLLGSDLRISGIPRLEEASTAMQGLFNRLNADMFIGGRTLFSLFEGDDADSFAKSIGLTWDDVESSLIKDIERFNLTDMIAFHRQSFGDFAIIASAGILSRFSTPVDCAKIVPYNFASKKFTTKIVASTFSTCTALFPDMDKVYLSVTNAKISKILVFTFDDLQDKLAKKMDSIGAGEDNPDRNLYYVLDNKRFSILEMVLEDDINKSTPKIEEVSKPLQIIFYRLLDSPAPELAVNESDADLFAKNIGCTWDEMEESLKRDIKTFNLSDAFHFHDGYAVTVNDNLLMHFSA